MDISSNKITSLEGFEALTKLTSLTANDNGVKEEKEDDDGEKQLN